MYFIQVYPRNRFLDEGANWEEESMLEYYLIILPNNNN